VGRSIKPTGNRFTSIYHTPNSVKLYIRALEAKHIGGAGFVHVAIGNGFLYLHTLEPSDLEPLLTTGMLFLVESGLENATSPDELEEYKLAKSIAMLADAHANAKLLSVTLYESLRMHYYNLEA
jgi:hypothetical protein